MRIGRDANLTISHLRHDLFGPGRFDLPFVHGHHRLGLEVHPAIHIADIRTCPRVNESREMCTADQAPECTDSLDCTDAPEPEDQYYPPLPTIELPGDTLDDPIPVDDPRTITSQTDTVIGCLIDILA